jgi:hypothetical protein
MTAEPENPERDLNHVIHRNMAVSSLLYSPLATFARIVCLICSWALALSHWGHEVLSTWTYVSQIEFPLGLSYYVILMEVSSHFCGRFVLLLVLTQSTLGDCDRFRLAISKCLRSPLRLSFVSFSFICSSAIVGVSYVRLFLSPMSPSINIGLVPEGVLSDNNNIYMWWDVPTWRSIDQTLDLVGQQYVFSTLFELLFFCYIQDNAVNIERTAWLSRLPCRFLGELCCLRDLLTDTNFVSTRYGMIYVRPNDKANFSQLYGPE